MLLKECQRLFIRTFFSANNAFIIPVIKISQRLPKAAVSQRAKKEHGITDGHYQAFLLWTPLTPHRYGKFVKCCLLNLWKILRTLVEGENCGKMCAPMRALGLDRPQSLFDPYAKKNFTAKLDWLMRTPAQTIPVKYH